MIINILEVFMNKFQKVIQQIIDEIDDRDFSDYISNYLVWLEKKNEWKDLRQAFKDHDVITDNYNTIFFESDNEEDKKRGFTLY